MKEATTWILRQPPPMQLINNPITSSALESPRKKAFCLHCFLTPV